METPKLCSKKETLRLIRLLCRGAEDDVERFGFRILDDGEGTWRGPPTDPALDGVVFEIRMARRAGSSLFKKQAIEL